MQINSLVSILAVAAMGLSACGSDKSKDRSSQEDGDSFYLEDSDKTGWRLVSAFGYRFLYPESEDEIEALTPEEGGFPVSILPGLTGKGPDGSVVSYVVNLDEEFSNDECEAFRADNESTPLARYPSVGWSTHSIDDNKRENGKYIPFITVYYGFGASCARVFIYEGTHSGIDSPFDIKGSDEMAVQIRNILSSFRKI